MANPHSNLQSLHDVMLAMDVVDTLRHADQMVDEALDSDARAAALIARLRNIYSAQGVQVSDATLAEGVAQLEQSRYSHRPGGAPWQRWLAGRYIRRHRWLRYVMLMPVLFGTLYVVEGVQRLLPGDVAVHSTRLSADLRSAYTEAASMADGSAMGHGNRIDALYHLGTVALEQGDKAAARQAIVALEGFSDALMSSYTLRIVDEPGTPSTIVRRDSLADVERHYLLVEPLNSRGRAVAVTLAGADGRQLRVKRYGIAVPEQISVAVRADKLDNGRIDARTVGYKAPGNLELDYDMPVLQETIAAW